MPAGMPPGGLPPTEERPESRIRFLRVIIILLFVVYSGRLFAMQILGGELYAKQAQDIARRTTIIPAQRGEIYDRDFSQPLVFSTDSFAVSVTPAEVPSGQIPALLERLAGMLNIPLQQLEQKLPLSYYYLYQAVEVAANIPYAAIAALAEQMDTLPGVSWQSKPVRNYQNIGSLSHVIGYVGDITRDELTTLYNAGYQQGDVIGKAGIERQYDELLRGKTGQETLTVDVRGRRIAGEDSSRQTPEMGKNIVLTIDSTIQTLAEKALGNRIGAVVVTRPSTGEILAMVSYPWYNPDIFTQSSITADYQALISDPNKPLLNRAIQSSYPPGSTFKILMDTGLRAENALSPDMTIECLGEITYGDRLWHCHIGRPGHGRLSLQQALAQSCDIYFWVAGRDYLGVENIVNYATDYGLGALTGIDLPGEIAGFIPTPQWKERRYHERWQNGDTMNMSIGQGYTLVTPLQMANLVSMVVNDGGIYKPHLLKEVRDPATGAVLETILPEVLSTSTVSPAVYESVRQDMRSVISAGTAVFPLNIRAVEIAGKTGTSEVGLQDHWHSWFTAFAPYRTDNPDERVVVSIIVEAANTWEWWATYASAIIYQGIFAHQTYEEAVAALGFQYLMPTTVRRD